ncbi:N-acetylmuramoyl-L-alanine amidase [Streptomyces humi]|uniref:N-acetylmuramoyl-L-alanine amidase n=1 Tax=Streptomyces humi TaxID=1428620 RepID=UPI0006288542|nr:N-acetylmuramoyl-L-alanine amidase [Streptomyces humi]
MSYSGPEFDPPQQRRPRRAPVAVGLAALVPGALLGWVVYEGVGKPGGSDAGRTGGSTTRSAPASASDDAKVPSPTAPALPLKGKVVVVDPGHNPGNFQHTSEINQKVDIGTNWKECDTTGTSTNAGYSEARFTLDVAHRLRTLLERQGATVKLTHDGDRPAWGPCVTRRAQIGNDAHADAAISIHADGAPEGDRGFHVILPASVHAGGADTRPIVASSRTLGERVEKDFAAVTGSAPSNYVGGGTGLDVRKDLGGLNLSTVPKVFIECGNMRDSTDAARLTSGAWRQKAAQGISDGITGFLRGA